MSAKDMFLELCLARPSGLSQKEAEQNGFNVDQFLECANQLLRDEKITLFTGTDQQLICRPCAAQGEKYKNLSPQDRMVLQEISNAGDKGVMTKDVSHKTNLPTQVVNRSTKNLEARNIIKTVKSIHSKRGKLWMLYDVVPSKEVAGGTWYKDGEFDIEKIEMIRKEVIQVLEHRAEPQPVEDIATSIEREVSDVQQILNILLLDDLIREVVQMTGKIKYEIAKSANIFFKCEDLPCFSCPVRSSCTWTTTGTQKIPMPRTCLYMSQWLYGNKVGTSHIIPMDMEDMVM